MKTVTLNFTKYSIILVLIFTVQIVYAQDLPDISICKTINSEQTIQNKEYTIVLISKAGCNYSTEAIDELTLLADIDNLSIIIFEFGDLSTIKFLHEDFFEYFPFVHADDYTFYENNFSPTVYLYKNSELVYDFEGWGRRSLRKLEKKIK